MNKRSKLSLNLVLSILSFLMISCANTGRLTVSDIDGNVYHTVTIGNQTWMVENLKTSHYKCGDAISNVTNNIEWSNLSTGAYCNYENNEANYEKYGKIYNWYAASDPRSIAPNGWHVATDKDWTTLTSNLGGENVAGGKLKETGSKHWNNPNTDAINEVGFSAISGGNRDGHGVFSPIGEGGEWWTANEDSVTTMAWYRAMSSSHGKVYRNRMGKFCGNYVRCVKDANNNDEVVEEDISKRISALLPSGAFLREYKKLVDVKEVIYIGLYVTDYKESTKPILPPSDPSDYDPTDSTLGFFYNCISQTNGQSLSGKYYAFVYKEGQITSLYKIPKPIADSIPVFLCLYNTPYNICTQYNQASKNPNCDNKSNKTLEKLDLIQLTDYTGDGKKNEFQLIINYTGCGFRDHMIIGFNEDDGNIMGYPIVDDGNKFYWLDRFEPVGGFLSIIYDCGDHGNDNYRRKDYKFNNKTLQYDKIYSKEKLCE